MGESSHDERKEAEVPSPFSAALAKLDGSLQTVHSQLDCLEAGLDVNDDRLIRSLIDARQSAARLRDLVRTQRPNAKWSDREALRQLVHEIELEIAAKARRNQQRRDKLMEVAGELEAGTVKHRFANRGTALNDLRLEAIAELKAEAGQSEEVKELPGPPAVDWLHWAVGLQESNDADLLACLRRDFPKLERFAGEMEESYWVPAQPKAQDSTPASSSKAGDQAPPARQSQAGLDAGSGGARPQAPAAAESYRAAKTADYDQSHSLPYNRRSNGHSSAPENGAERATEVLDTAKLAEDDAALFAAIAAAPHVNCCDHCRGTFPDTFKTCPFDNSPLRPIATPKAAARSNESAPLKQSPAMTATTLEAQGSSPQQSTTSSAASAVVGIAEKPNAHTAEDPAEAEFERLKALLVQHRATEPEPEVGLLDKIAEYKSRVIVWSSAVGVVLLVVVLVLVHSVIGVAARDLRATVASARAHLTGHVIVPDADIQRELGQKLAVLNNGNLQATVEDGVVTLAGECPTQWQSVEAESIASQVSGVKQVNNMVEIQPVEAAPPLSPTPNDTKHTRLKTSKK
jgi:hypothetical protein